MKGCKISEDIFQCAGDPNCPDPKYRSDFCQYHYNRKAYLKKIGKTEEETMSWRPNRPIEDKLWEQVTKSEDPNGCWMWTGRTVKGHGQVWHEGKHHYTHIVVYELLVGPVPEGLDLDHECHNEAARRGECKRGDPCPHRACCNPAHLIPRTRGENVKASVLWWEAVNETFEMKHRRKKGGSDD